MNLPPETALLAVLLCATALPLADAQDSIAIVPAAPTACDELVIEVERTFANDCDWTIESELGGFFDHDVQIRLLADRGSDICEPAETTVVAEIPLGRFAAGEWRFVIERSDGGEAVTIVVEVAEAVCDGGAGYNLGDTNADGRLDIADPITILQYLFLGGTVECLAAADVDNTRSIDLADVQVILNHLFLGLSMMARPPEECVAITADDRFDCESPTCNAGAGDDDATVWMALSDGCLQCSPCPNREIEEVVGELVAEDIEAFDATYGYLDTCLACDCPSGRYYLVRVTGADAARLEEQGWRQWGG